MSFPVHSHPTCHFPIQVNYPNHRSGEVTRTPNTHLCLQQQSTDQVFRRLELQASYPFWDELSCYKYVQGPPSQLHYISHPKSIQERQDDGMNLLPLLPSRQNAQFQRMTLNLPRVITRKHQNHHHMTTCKKINIMSTIVPSISKSCSFSDLGGMYGRASP